MKLIEEKQKINSKINIEMKKYSQERKYDWMHTNREKIKLWKKKIQELGTGDPTYLQTETEDQEIKLNNRTKY